MHIEHTNLEGCYIIKPTIFEDRRGYFFESFNENTFYKITGKLVHFVQDNQSYSTYGVLRGLHFQKGDKAQAKLTSVVKGEVLDVVVDLRPHSLTYREHISVKLSEKNKKMLFIARGLAHGFVVLSSEAVFQYKCDNYYYKEFESGIHYADPLLAINWSISESDLIVSDKDQQLPFWDISKFTDNKGIE